MRCGRKGYTGLCDRQREPELAALPDRAFDTDLTAVRFDGVFWHPLSTDADMQVSKKMFPLASAYERVRQQLDTMARTGAVPLMTFT
jgi:hypothetical protein